MKRYMHTTTIFSIIALLLTGVAFGQEEDEPIYPPFESQTLIDNQTTVNPYKGSLTLGIQHRFSQIKEVSDLFGIYGSANTRLGVNYGITDKIMLGFGTTRSYMQQDLEWKYSILTQTTSGKIPVSLSYYGNAVLDARESKYFEAVKDINDETEVPEYRFIGRFSYLHQVIASKRFGEKLSFQVAPTFVYYNAVPEGYRNDNYSVDVGGRLQVMGFHSIIFEYDQPLVQPQGDAAKTIYPNVSLGVEIGTSTHSFRVFASNYNAIVKNRSVAFNDRNPMDGDFQFGFNISIRF
ncbi:MAG: DUF5777 family beta-barrel protein [Bacteroidota bacterium]